MSAVKGNWNGEMHIILKKWPVHIVVLLVGLSLSFSAAWLEHVSQMEKARESFNYLAKSDYSRVVEKVRQHEETLLNIKNFYLSSRHVDREEFHTFTLPSFDKYKIFSAIGWVDVRQNGQEYYWSHVKPDRYAHIEGYKILQGSIFHEMLRNTINSGELSYFLKSVDGKNIGLLDDELETNSHYKIFVMLPVYKRDASNAEFLLGVTYSILNFNSLLENVFQKKGSLPLLNVSVEHQTETQSLPIYGMPESTVSAPFNSVEAFKLQELRMLWYFTPTEAFMQQHQRNTTYIIFIILCALTMALLLLREMATHMKILQGTQVKAEEANRLKSYFLATMSHEIRTPMTGILGMAELLLGSKLDKRQEGHARTIVSSAESLLNIINDILDFSKIEAGRLELDPVDVDMLDLVDDIGLLYSVQAREKAVEMVVHYHPGTEQFVFADPVRVRQIISNLVNNAIKFTDKGYIVITVEEDKDVSLPADKVQLIISIKDTGIGIPEDAQDKIFDKFSQADASTTRKFGGTGLGLAISKNLVEMMGGKIWLESELGKGSEFKFTLPLTRNHATVEKKPNAISMKGLKVLVVDDLHVILKLISEQLEEIGVECDIALNGEDALRKLHEAAEEGEPFQMAIIDYLMPEMNGEMLACAIKDAPAISNCCLVMLTAAGSPIVNDTFAEKGFSAHMSKPVQQHSLVESLALVWSKYKAGYTDVLIRVDAKTTNGGGDCDSLMLEGEKILMAEDNLVNQVFIQEILEEMKCDLTIAQNGQEALEFLKAGNEYSLILMDCLMPVLDGFEATRAICELKEQGIVAESVPIIALTANAMKGDRERCLEAGMNDYLSKPVRKQELKTTVYKWIVGKDTIQSDGGQNESEEYSAAMEDAESSPIDETSKGLLLDEQAVATARDILKAKFDTMVAVYIDNSWERIDEILKAINEDDIEGVIRPAHTLKSTSKQMGAVKLSYLAKDVEYIAKAVHKGEAEEGQDMQTISEALDGLRSAMEQTQQAFEDKAA